MTEVKPTHEAITYRGRWRRSENSSMIASWCGASLGFLFNGSTLRIRAGILTERKDADNGGIPMLAWSVSEGSDVPTSSTVKTADASRGQEIILVERKENERNVLRVELTMVDWASIFELDALIVDSVSSFWVISSHMDLIARSERFHLPITTSPSHHILFIGDSISSGMAHEPDELPRGCLDTFPFATGRALQAHDTSKEISVKLVATPGICLASIPNELGDEGERIPGMSDMFFQVCLSRLTEVFHLLTPKHTLSSQLGTKVYTSRYHLLENLTLR
jgi:hypothetical protein